MICPYCQSNIKNLTEAVHCSYCKTPHHKECWQENNGCTSFGCFGNSTNSRIKTCVHCGMNFPASNDVCSYCGKSQAETQCISEKTKDDSPQSIEIAETKTENEYFEKEFKKRAKELALKKRKAKLPILISLFVLFVLASVVLFVSIKWVLTYFDSEEYKIRVFVTEWRLAWESKDINRYKNFYDREFYYISKSGTGKKLDERMKIVENSFGINAEIKIKISDIKITVDSTNPDYANVTFRQNYTGIKDKNEKTEESVTKTLRLFRGTETDFKWKIFREIVN